MTKHEKIDDKTAYQIKLFSLVIFIGVLSFLMGWWDFGLPGLHVDEVNKAAFIPGILNESAALLHHYRLPDNYIDLQDGLSRYPIVGGAFYNSAITAYLGLPFYKIFGFSVDSVRYFHGGIGFLCVLLGSLLVARFAGFLSAFFFAAIVATNPDFVFSLRSQGAVLWPVVMFALAGGYLLLWAQSSINAKKQLWLVFFAGLCFGFSVMSYFVGAFIVLPILVYAWYGLKKSKKHYLVLLLGLLIGYLPVIYAVISVYLINPHLLDSLGMPDFASQHKVATFSSENLQRTLSLFQMWAGNFLFTKGVVGDFTDAAPALRTTVFGATVALGFLSLTRHKYLSTQTVVLAITSATFVIFFVGAFILKALIFHHLLLLFFVLAMQISVLISSNGSLKYLAIVLGAVLLVGNANALILAHRTLEKTGGVGYHHEMYSRIAETISSKCGDCYPVFISWGAHLQFLFLTEGRKKYSFLLNPSRNELKELIHQHGKIALIGSAADLDNLELSKKEKEGDEFNAIELRLSNDVRKNLSSQSSVIPDWGPQSTLVGVVPNPQPGNFAGIWVLTKIDPGFGEVVLIFDGKPAAATRLSGQTITAAIPADNFNVPGEKRISIKQVLTGKEILVGTFVVEAER